MKKNMSSYENRMKERRLRNPISLKLVGSKVCMRKGCDISYTCFVSATSICASYERKHVIIITCKGLLTILLLLLNTLRILML